MPSADDQRPIAFSVPGQIGPSPAQSSLGSFSRCSTEVGPVATPAALPGQIKVSVRVGTQRDSGATPLRVEAVPGEDIVALHVEDGPVLLLHPATARDLLAGAAGSSRSQDGAVLVSPLLQWPGADATAATRDIASVGRVALSAFQVLTGLASDRAARFAASQIVQRVDGQVDAGVYALRADRFDASLKGSGARLAQLPATPQPVLVLLHGTFVDTFSTFHKLWDDTLKGAAERRARLFQAYGNRVYALDHPTLGASPIANARTLVDALPAGARLHLVSHSRGGLVAEVLARVAGQAGGVGAADLAFFAGDAEQQRDELTALAAAVSVKKIRVERVVRVACPARGTLLAAKRLDAYVSVLKWTLDIAGVPILPTLLDFIGEVARRRAEPSEIPGLAAMMPDTPLVNWLNAAPEPIAGDLRVVAGDLEHGSTLLSWVKVLLADAYYWTDNDIVVHTRSMYGGAPRIGGSTFLLDQGSGVTHFSYFANEKTANAVVDALVSEQAAAGFRPIGPLSWAGTDAGGERGLFSGEVTTSAPDAGKPAVFVLPGILGSNLQHAGRRIWLSPRLLGGFERLAYQADAADSVLDDGPIGMVYGDLTAYLNTTHEVIPFGYDWRRPLEEEAARLARRVRQALDARGSTGQPVRVLAHSMGGLLARTLQLVDNATWQRLMSHPGARFVMLGTPNAGSWAPMQVLSGDDTFGNALAAVGSPFSSRNARRLMAQMPGLLQLQAGLLDTRLGLGDAATWEGLAQRDRARELQKNWWQRHAGDIVGATCEWGEPAQAVLDRARALRQKLDAQIDGALKECAEHVLLVVGHAKFTPDGFEEGGQGFVYRDAQDGGDGRVTLASALLPGVRTWSLDCEHGRLPSQTAAFEAYADLLMRGTTARLTTLAAATASRGAFASAAPLLHVRSRPAWQRPTGLPPGDAHDVLSSIALADAAAGSEPPLPALKISVLNGNLAFCHQPLLLGHYRALELTGSERVIDGHIGGAMGVALRAGLYPEGPGTHRIFFNRRLDESNPWQLPRPRAAVIVGLGEEGQLSAERLAGTVMQGVKAWSQRAAEETPGISDGIELAAVLVGSGGIGVGAADSARAIAQGVLRANQRLAGSNWPLIARLTLVELYLDRAGEAWHGLRVLATASPQAFEIAPLIAPGTGALRRQAEGGYRGAEYDLISVTTAAAGSISFALDTRRARTEVRAQHTQPRLVQLLVERAATSLDSDARLGSTLFKLLVPLEIKPFLAGNERLVLQLDDGTAPIPWELLDTERDEAGSGAGATASGGELPWSIRTRLLRKLCTDDFRADPRDAGIDAAVLVVGEPLIDTPGFASLPGARREAAAVARLLQGPDGLAPGLVTALVAGDADDAAAAPAPSCQDVIVGLMARPYRIVHVAGHGMPIQADAAGVRRGGVVLSNDVFLGPDELLKLPEVPELVFINCCHLGGHAAQQALRLQDPPAFAAGVADALISIGVRCVIAAGWAVDDEPAMVFATRFYAALLHGATFIDAVHEARKAAYSHKPDSKTWAAYQCYGDPNWTFRPRHGAVPGPAPGTDGEFSGVASAPGLALVLETLAVTATHQPSASSDDAAARQRRLAGQRAELQRQLGGWEARYSSVWGGIGAVAEAFAVAWNAAGDADRAIDWYARALQANDGSASVKAFEQHGNLCVRRALRRAQAATQADARASAQGDLVEALQRLQALAALQPTAERLSLCGSGLKRLAQLMAHDPADATQARATLQQALKAYSHAEDIAVANDLHLFYPGMNRMAIELVLRAGDGSWGGFDADAAARVRNSLLAAHASAPDFWTNAGLIEFDLYAALAQGDLAPHVAALADGFTELHARVPAQSAWGSVADQMRFVLAPPLATGRGGTDAAGSLLLALLDGFAGFAGSAGPAALPEAAERARCVVIWAAAARADDARRLGDALRRLTVRPADASGAALPPQPIRTSVYGALPGQERVAADLRLQLAGSGACVVLLDGDALGAGARRDLMGLLAASERQQMARAFALVAHTPRGSERPPWVKGATWVGGVRAKIPALAHGVQQQLQAAIDRNAVASPAGQR